MSKTVSLQTLIDWNEDKARWHRNGGYTDEAYLHEQTAEELARLLDLER